MGIRGPPFNYFTQKINNNIKKEKVIIIYDNNNDK